VKGSIRDFAERDYEAVIAVQNVVFPDFPDSVEEWRHYDAHRDPKIRWRRFVYEEESRIVAYGGYTQWGMMYHPRKFHLSVNVPPAERGRGIGSALYEHLVRVLADFDPLVLRGMAREDQTGSLRFAGKRGYRETIRECDSELDLGRFVPSQYDEHLARVREAGFAILPYAELAGESDLQRWLYELDLLVSADVPMSDVLTRPDFKAYCGEHFENPNFLPALYTVARDGEGRLVGLSNLWRSTKKGYVETGLTGVVRECRKKGVATALKVSALGAAKAAGYVAVRTSNEAGNDGMLGINRSLGFQPLPAWLGLEKTLKEE